MESNPIPTPKPPNRLTQWYENAIHWAGWEDLYEHRRQVILILAICLLIIGLIGWFIARRSSASVYSTIRAENIVDRLLTEDTRGEEGFDQPRETKILESLAPVKSALGKRFSGVIAEEQVLAGTKIDPSRFYIAAAVLKQANLPLQALVVEATQLCAENKQNEALVVVDKILSQGVDFKELNAYALLQKATLLRSLQQPNVHVIAEIKQLLSKSPEIASEIEEWCGAKPEQLCNFLQRKEITEGNG